jgi:hypothetical protein
MKLNYTTHIRWIDRCAPAIDEDRKQKGFGLQTTRTKPTR